MDDIFFKKIQDLLSRWTCLLVKLSYSYLQYMTCKLVTKNTKEDVYIFSFQAEQIHKSPLRKALSPPHARGRFVPR